MIPFTTEENPFDFESIEKDTEIDFSIQLKQRRIDELEKKVKYLESLLLKYEDIKKTNEMVKDTRYSSWSDLLKALGVPVNPFTLEHAEAIKCLSENNEHHVERGVFLYLKKYGKLSHKQKNVMYGVVDRTSNAYLKKQGIKL